MNKRLPHPNLKSLYLAIDQINADKNNKRTPLIGITTVSGNKQSSVPDLYIDAVLKAGGSPVLIPVIYDIPALSSLIENLDGLLVPGGYDVNPLFFEEEPIPQLTSVDTYLDLCDFTALRYLIIEDGSYATDDELKNRKNRYSKYIKNSNLWQVIVSFNNPYIDSSIKLEDLEQLMIKKIIPDFIRDCGFEDLSKMSYQTSLHSNNDNYHFHFSFIEKSPNTRDSENRLVYRKVGTLPMMAIDNLKRNILLSIDREKVFKI